jgi:hypothetical protein
MQATPADVVLGAILHQAARLAACYFTIKLGRAGCYEIIRHVCLTYSSGMRREELRYDP